MYSEKNRKIQWRLGGIFKNLLIDSTFLMLIHEQRHFSVLLFSVFSSFFGYDITPNDFRQLSIATSCAGPG